MPSNYHFGITAASAETADSFEAYKFTLTTALGITREEPRRQQQAQQQQQSSPVDDTPASSIQNQDAQFADLHDRLQLLSHSIDTVSREVKALAEKSEGRHQELSRNFVSADKLSAIDQRLQGIEKTVRDYQGQFSNLQGILKDSHSSLAESLPKHMGDIINTSAPRMGLLLFVFVGVQLLLAGAYIIYKRRRAQGPKKYL
ncbi:hypothetical protein P7C71_g3968, partial [Lecanoromycetidae sp. Uapishka_2]